MDILGGDTLVEKLNAGYVRKRFNETGEENGTLTGYRISFETGDNLIRIREDGVTEIPVQGRKAAGVRGVKLGDGDAVAFGGQIDDEGEIIVMTDAGYLKRVIASTIDPGSRYLKGVKIVELDRSKVVYIGTVKMPYDLAVNSGAETFRINTEDIRLDTRTTKGKQMFKAGIISAAKLPE